MMPIIAASRLRGLPEPNTFIGDASFSLDTASDLASRTTLSVSDIQNFQKVGDNISCYIGVNYEIDNFAFGFSSIDKRVKYFIDLNGFCISINRAFSVQDNKFSFLDFVFANNANVGDLCFENAFNLRYLVSDRINNLGTTVNNDSIFRSIGFSIDKAIAYYPSFLKTVNSGSPDGDIQILTDIQGSQVVYKNSTDYVKPTAPTISATTNIGGTYVELNVSKPTHVSTLKYALVFVNGFFNDVYDIDNVYAFKLQEEKSYDIKVIIADEYFNLSPYSNTIKLTTTTIDREALFQNAVAYYKLDELSGQAIDIVNGYNGNLFGGVTQGLAGKIGNAYGFDGTGYVNIPNPEIFSSNSFFTFRAWFRTTDTARNAICSLFNGVNNGEFYRITIDNGSIFLAVGGGNVTFDGDFNDGNWHRLVINHPQNASTGAIECYVDNTFIPITNEKPREINPVSSDIFIGRNFTNIWHFNGEIDEICIDRDYNLTLEEISEDYNNGNGITY